MTKIDTLEVSIELLRLAHKRLREVGETSVADSVRDAIMAVFSRLEELRKENAR